MKKFTKVCLTLSLVMFLAGVGCIIAGLVNGGNPITAASDVIRNVEDVFSGYESDFDENYRMEEFELVGEYSVEELESLDLELQVGKVVVKETSGSACRIWIDESSSEYAYNVGVQQENGVLYIRDKAPQNIDVEISVSALSELFDLLRGDDLKSIGAQLIIEVPQTRLQQFNADIEMGTMKIYDLHADKIEVNVEAGNMFAEGTLGGEEVIISAGLGDVRMNQVEAKVANLDVEMGSIQAQSVVSDKLVADVEMGDMVLNQVQASETHADVEMGDIDIEFAGDSTNYDISCDVELGDVEVENNVGHNSQAPYKAYVNCEMGNVDITFSDDTV